jgi:hypothetical protein
MKCPDCNSEMKEEVYYGKLDYLFQINCYCWFLVKAGFEVKKAYINAILKDWSKNERLRFGRDYPEIPFKRLEIPLWSFDEQEKYIGDRIALYKSTLNLSDENLPICSPEERWATPEKWAVHKNKNKTAKKLCLSYKEACEYVSKIKDTKNKYNIIKRNGNDVRCQGYCSCNKFCSFYLEKYGNKE